MRCSAPNFQLVQDLQDVFRCIPMYSKVFRVPMRSTFPWPSSCRPPTSVPTWPFPCDPWLWVPDWPGNGKSPGKALGQITRASCCRASEILLHLSHMWARIDCLSMSNCTEKPSTPLGSNILNGHQFGQWKPQSGLQSPDQNAAHVGDDSPSAHHKIDGDLP